MMREVKLVAGFVIQNEKGTSKIAESKKCGEDVDGRGFADCDIVGSRRTDRSENLSVGTWKENGRERCRCSI